MKWKKIEGYPDYEISDNGLVLSLKTGTVLSLSYATGGYTKFKLYNGDSTYKMVKGHRLVAEHFIPNPENKPFVCHKDDDPSNNCADNLFWGTLIENVMDMVSKDRHHRMEILCLETGEIYKSQYAAARDLNLLASKISLVVNGNRKHTGGFTFEKFI